MNGYENDPPFWVFLKLAFWIAPATQDPSAASGVFLTLTLDTLPPGETFTETLTSPFADDLSPQLRIRLFTLPTPAEIAARSSSSGRSLLSPPPPLVGTGGLGLLPPPPL